MITRVKDFVFKSCEDSEFKPAADDSNLKEGWGSWMMRGGGLFRPRTSSAPTATQGVNSAPSSPTVETETPEDATPNLTLKTNSISNYQKPIPEFNVTNDTFLTRDELFANISFNLASGTIHLKVESSEYGSATRVLYGSDVDDISHGRSLRLRSKFFLL